MNVFDYLFENTRNSKSLFLIGREEISFADLYSDCNEISTKINSLIGKEKHILLLSSNNLFFIKSYLSIIKSDNIVIPLDPLIEETNLNYIIEQTHPSLIFLTRELSKKFDFDESICIYPDDLETQSDKKETSFTFQQKDTNSDSVAEIIFTSGSTGLPKGVKISHINIIANTSSIIESLNLKINDRMLVVLPFYYCYGLSLLHTHIRIGGSIVLNNTFMFLGKTLKDLKDYECTGFAGVPSHFQVLLRISESFRTSKFPHLRYVTQAGGHLSSIFIDEFKKDLRGVDFFIMYGQTEATARLTCLNPDDYERKKGSAGKAIPGVRLQIADKNGNLLGNGKIGEVIATGENIMEGYFADEEGTKKTIKDGWLHTGDLGLLDEEGFLFLKARKKEIIKVGGKRISPKEIESVILQINGVVDCVIHGVESQLQGESIIATVTIAPAYSKKITDQTIKDFCKENLAHYKIPSIIKLTDKITLSATGKRKKIN